MTYVATALTAYGSQSPVIGKEALGNIGSLGNIGQVNVGLPSNLQGYGQLGGALVGVGLAAYDLSQAAKVRDRFTQAMATANLVNSIAGIFVPGYAMLQGIANIQMGLAHGFFKAKEAKKQAHRDLRNIGYANQRAMAEGHHPAIAARLAIASRGYDPEQFVPIGSSFANYNPRTGASDTVLGLLLDYGEGPEADAARERKAREIEGELFRRPYPAQGVVPGPFVRTRRG